MLSDLTKLAGNVTFCPAIEVLQVRAKLYTTFGALIPNYIFYQALEFVTFPPWRKYHKVCSSFLKLNVFNSIKSYTLQSILRSLQIPMCYNLQNEIFENQKMAQTPYSLKCVTRIKTVDYQDEANSTKT